ncbi:MAG: hypothetical protein R3E56_16645 [Burkholderiaceae bacterium]
MSEPADGKAQVEVSNLESQLRHCSGSWQQPRTLRTVPQAAWPDLIAQRKALTAELGGHWPTDQDCKRLARLPSKRALLSRRSRHLGRCWTRSGIRCARNLDQTGGGVAHHPGITDEELERQRDAIQANWLAARCRAQSEGTVHPLPCGNAAEIELHEQLMPVMNTLARASAARRQINFTTTTKVASGLRFLSVDPSRWRCTGGRNASGLIVTQPAKADGSFLAKRHTRRERACPLPTEPETGLPDTTPVYRPAPLPVTSRRL